MEDLISSIVKEEISKLELKEKMTGFLVKKKKRGTHQALQESTEEEAKILEDLQKYAKDWVVSQLVMGTFREALKKEMVQQAELELFRRGFTKLV